MKSPLFGFKKGEHLIIRDSEIRRKRIFASKRPIRHLIFDLDDNLFPSTQFSNMARRNALNAMIEFGLDAKYEELEKMLLDIIGKRGSNYTNHFDLLLKRLKVPVHYHAAFIAAAVRAYHNTKSTLTPYPDVHRNLISLRENFLLYVASDGLAVKQWDKLIRMGIPFLFDDVFVSETLRRKKEQPAFYTGIVQTIGAKPEECVMVGDREDRDVVSAKKAGLFAVRMRRPDSKYCEGKTVADEDIKSLDELEAAIMRIVNHHGLKPVASLLDI
ncbi:HAD hydrolase-like protein [Candidatus Micrarchaeota archaeon]|nr:HAD hydrolase-like protein [Candidatus Micrarchaeota archaeon]